jgi:hypothetical protein
VCIHNLPIFPQESHTKIYNFYICILIAFFICKTTNICLRIYCSGELASFHTYQVGLVCVVVTKQQEGIGARDGDVNSGRVHLRELNEVALLGGGEGKEEGEQNTHRLHYGRQSFVGRCKQTKEKARLCAFLS